VLEGQLAREKELHSGDAGFDGPWLVGNKLSYADIAFVPWQASIVKTFTASGDYDEAEFPLVTEWLAKLSARESVKKAMAWSK
jgi:glutathione S-transferase